LNWAKNHFGKDWKKQVLYGTLVRYENEGAMLVADWEYDHEEYPLQRGKVKVAAAAAPVKSVEKLRSCIVYLCAKERK
jgi:hypothetical protein